MRQLHSFAGWHDAALIIILVDQVDLWNANLFIAAVLFLGVLGFGTVSSASSLS